MQPVLPLDKMTVEEKLRVIDEVWNDLIARSEEIPPPAWHAEVLAEREKLVREGKAQFYELDDAKRILAERLKQRK